MLDAALNASRISPAVLDLLAETEAVRKSNLHVYDPIHGVCRVSSLLLDQLAESYVVNASHLNGILDAIKMLEGIGTPTNAKAPAAFKPPPLRGLWHQHYLSAVFLAKNLANEMKRMGKRSTCASQRSSRTQL